MFVVRRMQRKVVTALPETSLFEARERMRGHSIHQLPVVEGDGKLVGIVSNHDVRETILPSALLPGLPDSEVEQRLRRTPVGEVMTRKVVTAALTDTLEDAVALLHDFRVNALPVVDEQGRVAGIITRTDVLQAVIDALGVGEVSSRIEVAIPDKPGGLAQIVNIIKSFNINITSVLTVGHREEGMRINIFRLATINPAPIKQAIRDAGYRVLEARDFIL